MQTNQPVVVDLVNEISTRRGATPAQVALAWLLAKYAWIVPIPGTKKLHRLEENIAAADLILTEQEVQEIDTRSETISIVGARANGQESYD